MSTPRAQGFLKRVRSCRLHSETLPVAHGKATPFHEAQPPCIVHGVPKDGARTRQYARRKSRGVVNPPSPVWHADAHHLSGDPYSWFHQMLIETGRGGNVHEASIASQGTVQDEFPHPGHDGMAISGESKSLPRGLKPSRVSSADRRGGVFSGLFGFDAPVAAKQRWSKHRRGRPKNFKSKEPEVKGARGDAREGTLGTT